jgi:hypothetical protein
MSAMPFCDHLVSLLDQLGEAVDGVLDDDQQIQREILEHALAELLADQPREVATRVLLSLTSIAMIEVMQRDDATEACRRSVS